MKKKLLAIMMISTVQGNPAPLLSLPSDSGPVFAEGFVRQVWGSANTTNEKKDLSPVISRTVAGYTLPQVLDLALASSMAYKDKKGEDLNLSEYGFTKIYSMKSDSNSWFVGDNAAFVGLRHDGSLVLSFAGTTSLRNLATDFWANWAFDHENGGCYHNGIFVAFRSLQDQMMAIFNQIAKEKSVDLSSVIAQTKITGHSLGGAMALIAADTLRRQGFETQGVVTFAAPRVMDMVTAKEYDMAMKDKTLILKQFTDPVPVISPFLLGSKQVGNQVILPFVFDTWQHLLGGYIEALETMKYGDGKINVSRLTFGGLREKQAWWYFEADKTKDQLIPTLIKSGFSLSWRALHRASFDLRESVNIVYDHSLVLGDAAQWTLSKTIEAMGEAARIAKDAASGGHQIYKDTSRTMDQKIVDVISWSVSVAAETIQSTTEVIKEAVHKTTPTAVSTVKWLGSKIWQRTKDFIGDFSKLSS